MKKYKKHIEDIHADQDDFAGNDFLAEEALIAAEESEKFTGAVPGETIVMGEQHHLEDSRKIEHLTRKPADKYKFEHSLGFGGMKAVLQTRDRDTGRSVAMAVIPDFKDRPQADINRFIQEARITALLEHPNIVPIHDIGVDDNGSPYFTMKNLRGRTMALLLKKLKHGERALLQRYDLTVLLRIFLKVCNATALAHSKGVIHLDLKPENIHIGDYGEVLVMDWGLAKYIGNPEDDGDPNPHADIASAADFKKRLGTDGLNLTLNGVTKGTPGYMAPEQAAGKNNEKDERTDVYSLGAILYSILTFDTPLPNRDVKEMLVDTIHGNIESPRRIKAQRYIPPAVEAIVLKAMRVNPEERYQTVQELRSDIIAYMSGYATTAEHAGAMKHTFLFVERNLMALLLTFTLCALLCLIGVIIYFTYSGNINF
jgi:serine/threonine protein kinase